MILITGSSGKTGRALLDRLKLVGEPVRAIVHRPVQVPQLIAAGAQEALLCDLLSPGDLEQACRGVRAIYHICPNMHPEEIQIGRNILAAAAQVGIERFVYHSVFHPQTEAMPHHWNKLRVEEMIFTARLPFTILQPCVYMQNVFGYWQPITAQGIYAVPYSIETYFSMVDLNDIADVAAEVLTESGHLGATYELCGPQALTIKQMAGILSQELGISVQAQVFSLSEWDAGARASGMGYYSRQTLLKMFAYYDNFGFSGSPSVLAWLLKRQPTTFREFVQRTVEGNKAGLNQ
jgi:NAD(P)H dehydrogenase (quinone)